MSDFRLKAFYSVAKNLSFTRAAKELFVSQPAITKHINELERQYSVRLFDRTGGKIMLTNGNSRDIENALLNHDIDLGMVEGITHSAGLQYEPFLEDELVAIIKQSGNESMPEEITPQELCRQPLVIREQGSGTLEVIETELEKHGIRPQELNIRIRLGSTEAIKAFLRHSRSMGIVSVFSVREELARGVFRVIDIAGLNFSRHFCFVASAGKDSPLTEKFKDFTRRSIITSGYRV